MVEEIIQTEGEIGAWATANVVLEIKCTSSWGANCTVAQVHKQAIDEIRDYLAKKSQGDFRVKIVEIRPTSVSGFRR
jgi:hypothetical protein